MNKMNSSDGYHCLFALSSHALCMLSRAFMPYHVFRISVSGRTFTDNPARSMMHDAATPALF